MENNLIPRGGPWWKNRLGAGLTLLGKRPDAIARDLTCIDRRVPPEQSGDPLYNDSFVFQGASADGTLFLGRIAFRGDGRRAEVWVLLERGGVKRVNTNLEVELDPTHDGETAAGDAIEAGGLAFRPVGGGRWDVGWAGPLDDGSACELSLRFEPDSAAYLSSRDMDPVATGRAMGEMPWSLSWLRKLGSERQVRMEQGGRLAGTLTLDGEPCDLDLRGIRDHSWGRRDWTYLRRYLWYVIALERPLVVCGEPVSYVCYTGVDYGPSFRRLVAGWMAGPSRVFPIVQADDFSRIATDGHIPHTHELRLRPRGGPLLCGTVERVGVPQPWPMQGGRFEVNEALCHVTLEGVRGVGLSELGFSDGCGIPRPLFEQREDR